MTATTITHDKYLIIVDRLNRLRRENKGYNDATWSQVFKDLGCYEAVDQLDTTARTQIDDYCEAVLQGALQFVAWLQLDAAETEAAAAAKKRADHLAKGTDIPWSVLIDGVMDVVKLFVTDPKAKLMLEPVSPAISWTKKAIESLKKFHDDLVTLNRELKIAKTKERRSALALELTRMITTAVNQVEEKMRESARAFIYELAVVLAVQSMENIRATFKGAGFAMRSSMFLENVNAIRRATEKAPVREDQKRHDAIFAAQVAARSYGVAKNDSQGRIVLDLSMKEISFVQKEINKRFPVTDAKTKNAVKDQTEQKLRNLLKDAIAKDLLAARAAEDKKIILHFHDMLGFGSKWEGYTIFDFAMAYHRVFKAKLPEDFERQHYPLPYDLALYIEKHDRSKFCSRCSNWRYKTVERESKGD